jgi:hypothetical protein
MNLPGYLIPDWLIVSGLALWIAPFFARPFFDRLFEKRSKLVAYLLNATSVSVNPPNGSRVLVNLHSVVIRNNGRKPALNVRLGHNMLREVDALPDFSIFPNIQYSIEPLPSGGREIVFPILVPGEQVTIQYLYFAPILWHEINTHIKCNDGNASILTVLPTPQLSTPKLIVVKVFFYIGVIVSIYLLFLLLTFLARIHNHAVVGAL